MCRPWTRRTSVEPLSSRCSCGRAAAGQPWQAELRGQDGVRTVFTTPLELLRHLADIAGPRDDQGGLR
jgi:hypothetical protein